MLWYSQYEVTALFIIALFIFYFSIQKALPMRKSYAFNAIMRTSFEIVVTDLIASYLCTFYDRYPSWILEFSNELYFFGVVHVFYLIFAYCWNITAEYAKKPILRMTIYKIPLFVMLTILLTNPITGYLFTANKYDGFRRGPLFYSVFVPYCLLYLVMSISYFFYHRKYFPFSVKAPVLFTLFLILSFYSVQVFLTPYVLLFGISLALGSGILYLSIQNPDFDKNSKTKVYTAESFKRYCDELLRNGIKTRYIGIEVASYKTVIKIYGQEKANAFITSIADFLRKKIKGVKTFYLHKGKFVLVLNSDINEKIIFDRLCEYFSQTYRINGNDLIPLVHFVFIPRIMKTETVNDVLECIQMGFDMQKDKNSLTLLSCDQDLYDSMVRDREIRRALHEAVDKDNLQIFFQPIFNNEKNRITSAEVLVRIDDAKLGIIPPDSFIPIAEEDGTILRLGLQVFHKVCQFIREHNLDDIGLEFIEMNLSPIQLMHSELADELIAISHRYEVGLSNINFEITETSTSDITSFRQTMNRLIGEGAKFSLDDYGIGYSNLINVLSMPFQIVKIDKSIVWGYFNGTDSLLPRLIEMFQEDGLMIVAEGVETEHMQHVLGLMNCHYSQGYLYSKPIPQEQFLIYMQKHKAICDIRNKYLNPSDIKALNNMPIILGQDTFQEKIRNGVFVDKKVLAKEYEKNVTASM